MGHRCCRYQPRPGKPAHRQRSHTHCLYYSQHRYRHKRHGKGDHLQGWCADCAKQQRCHDRRGRNCVQHRPERYSPCSVGCWSAKPLRSRDYHHRQLWQLYGSARNVRLSLDKVGCGYRFLAQWQKYQAQRRLYAPRSGLHRDRGKPKRYGTPDRQHGADGCQCDPSDPQSRQHDVP